MIAAPFIVVIDETIVANPAALQVLVLANALELVRCVFTDEQLEAALDAMVASGRIQEPDRASRAVDTRHRFNDSEPGRAWLGVYEPMLRSAGVTEQLAGLATSCGAQHVVTLDRARYTGATLSPIAPLRTLDELLDVLAHLGGGTLMQWLRTELASWSRGEARFIRELQDVAPRFAARI